jgi:hypothetical protein
VFWIVNPKKSLACDNGDISDRNCFGAMEWLGRISNAAPVTVRAKPIRLEVRLASDRSAAKDADASRE